MKVLIVDDDPQTVDALTVGLQPQWQDCEVVTAGGEAGEQAFFDHDPDVVLLEPALADRSGDDVLRAIRRVSDVPVLIVSARGGETDQVKGLELGADDYLVKPACVLAVLAHIRAVLRRAELPPPRNAQPDFVAGDLTIHFQGRQVMVRGSRSSSPRWSTGCSTTWRATPGACSPTRPSSTGCGGRTTGRRRTT